MTNEIFRIKVSSIIESTIGNFVFWIILGAFSLLFSKHVRRFLKAHWPLLVTLALFAILEIGIYILAGGLSIVWLSLAHCAVFAAVAGLWIWRTGPSRRLSFRVYPFDHLVGTWTLKFAYGGKQGTEQASIDYDGKYYTSGAHRFTLKNMNYDPTTNFLSYDKVEISGRIRHREVLRMAYSSCIFLGHKDGDENHTLRYERVRSGRNEEQ